MSPIVVAHLQLFEEVELIVAQIVGITKECWHIHVLEVAGQCVVAGIPLIVELVSFIRSCAVFAIGTSHEIRFP